MHRSTTRRPVVAAALAAPLIVAKGAIAQERTPSPPDAEAIVGSFYEPFNTGDTSFSDTIRAEDWVDTPLVPGQDSAGDGR